MLLDDDRLPTSHRLESSEIESGSETGGQALGSHGSLERFAQTPSATFIQSAVRSVLDEATPSTIASDNKSDYGDCSDGGFKTPRGHVPPSLASLCMEKAAPLPTEQDRRCFIGCLATALACAYDFDRDENDGGQTPGSSLSYADSVALHTEEEWDVPIHHVYSTDSEKADDPKIYSQHERFTGSSSKYPVQEQSSKKHNPASSSGERSRLSRLRSRKRRYDVLSKLLLSSAELLLLDESVARAFLPMLSRLLTSRAAGTKAKFTHDEENECHSRGKTSFSDSTSLYSSSREGWENKAANQKQTVVADDIDPDAILCSFLESMSPGSGFRCLALFLLQYLLSSGVGYDARVRHVLKRVGVIILAHEMRDDPVEQEFLPNEGKAHLQGHAYRSVLRQATRKFESLEHGIARRLIRLSESREDTPNGKSKIDASKRKKSGITKESILRGVKIGSAGIVAGTLFAWTGGLAAPGIAAGVAAVTGSGAAATAAVVALTSTAVVTTIFGVGGGSLAAYKMQRRTQGLTEFEFIRAFTGTNKAPSKEPKTLDAKHEAELFTTICISGWLRDKYDFQRPWGFHPSNPKLKDPLELLERFYAVVRPSYVRNCERILSRWKGEEKELWNVLRKKYGRDPDNLFPLATGPRLEGRLTLEQEEAVDRIFVELGYNSVAPKNDSLSGSYRTSSTSPGNTESLNIANQNAAANRETSFDLVLDRWLNESTQEATSETHNHHHYEGTVNEMPGSDVEVFEPPRHLTTVWNFSTTYAGEVYTVRWESSLLKTICECVMDLAMDVVNGATRQILKQTVLSTLLAAVVWPSYLLNLANMIDGDWTLAVERADEAGKELANTLLLSRAGQRPVTLVGFSFGARVIYSCLKELSRLQNEWEDYEEEKQITRQRSAVDKHRFARLERKFSGMREPSSVVEDAIVMGLPNHLSTSSWRACRQIVAGRLVNCYSTKDLILSLMFQAKRFSPGVQTILKPVCGTCQVNTEGVENVDISDLVQGHQDYCLMIGSILKRVNFGEPRVDSFSGEMLSSSGRLVVSKLELSEAAC